MARPWSRFKYGIRPSAAVRVAAAVRTARAVRTLPGPVDSGPSSPLRRPAVIGAADLADRGVREPAAPARLRRAEAAVRALCGGRCRQQRFGGASASAEEGSGLHGGFPPCGGAPTPYRGTHGDFGPRPRLVCGGLEVCGCSCVVHMRRRPRPAVLLGALQRRKRSRFAVTLGGGNERAPRPRGAGSGRRPDSTPVMAATGAASDAAVRAPPGRVWTPERSGIWALAGPDHCPSCQLAWGWKPARPCSREVSPTSSIPFDCGLNLIRTTVRRRGHRLLGQPPGLAPPVTPPPPVSTPTPPHTHTVPQPPQLFGEKRRRRKGLGFDSPRRANK